MWIVNRLEQPPRLDVVRDCKGQFFRGQFTDTMLTARMVDGASLRCLCKSIAYMFLQQAPFFSAHNRATITEDQYRERGKKQEARTISGGRDNVRDFELLTAVL
jgi:hypothetical protein